MKKPVCSPEKGKRLDHVVCRALLAARSVQWNAAVAVMAGSVVWTPSDQLYPTLELHAKGQLDVLESSRLTSDLRLAGASCNLCMLVEGLMAGA